MQCATQDESGIIVYFQDVNLQCADVQIYADPSGLSVLLPPMGIGSLPSDDGAMHLSPRGAGP